MKRSTLTRGLVPTAVVLTLALAACGNSPEETGEEAAPGASAGTDGADAEAGSATGNITIDGSSTVGPLTDAISEEFAAVEPDVIVDLGISGTGGGFERFCNDETDISNASRPITEEEIAACEENGVEYFEIRVATDALSMVVNNENDWVDCLTTEEVLAIWGPDGASNWSEVREGFPDEALEVFAPGTDSGTYDFFNEVTIESVDIEEPRQDFNASEDDNVIVQGVQGTRGGWGYFGFSYFEENPDALKAIEFDNGGGCVAPSVETAQDDSYGLTRPLFIYLKATALERPEVQEFATFYLDTVPDLVADVGFIPATDEQYTESQGAVADAIASVG